MKKIYTSPVMQQERFETADIITVSPQGMKFIKKTVSATTEEAVKSLDVSGLFDTPQ